MLRRDWYPICLVLLVAGSVIAVLTAQTDGGDYFFDSASIDAAVRGDWSDFFQEQPLMGALSMLVRAPFVALVFDSSLTTVYFVGVIPCYLALLVLARYLWSHMDGRPLSERAAVVLLCVGSPFAVRAIHWGHPEEFLATALCIGAMLAAGRDRPLVAGVLLGLGYATKQWAVVAAAPVLATLPSHHWRFVATAALVGLAFTLPMVIGDPERFWLVTRAAGSSDPSAVLGLRDAGFPEGRVAPHSLWLPLGAEQSINGRSFFFMSPALADLTHPLIVLIGLPVTWVAFRRAGGPLPLLSALRLLALVFVLRCALDPNDLDYYHVPVVAALAAMAAFGTRADLMAALAATTGLSLAFGQPTDDLAALTANAPILWAVYVASVVPLCWWLCRPLMVSRSQSSGPSRTASAASPG